ncbi:MAG: hypothetical protein ACI4RV_04105, partial [Eubacteriales bacterium]
MRSMLPSFFQARPTTNTTPSPVLPTVSDVMAATLKSSLVTPFFSNRVLRVTKNPYSSVSSFLRSLRSTTAAKRKPLFVPKRIEYLSNISG